MTTRAESDFELNGRHVLAVFLGFFAIIFAVNGVFLYSALSTHTGVVAQEPYRKGLEYNQRIAADERQSALGWKNTATVGRDGRLVVEIVDAQGNAVAGLRIAGTFGRPSTGQFDRQLVFAEPAPGRYEASAGALEAGGYLLYAEAYDSPSAAAEPIYRTRQRLWLKP